MYFSKILFTVSIALLTQITIHAQMADSSIRLSLVEADSIPVYSNIGQYDLKNKFPLKSFAIPIALVTYGIASLEAHSLKAINEDLQEEIWIERPHMQKRIDSYLMFAPAASVYALNSFGIKGKNNFTDRTMIYLMSNIIVTGIIYPAKKIANQLRPDASSYSSFPSGHTATAFASAEFMRMEYKDKSPWYGVAGYMMATATAYLRMYNNKHWFSDVVAGAGIGIASTKLSYWLYPKIKKAFFKNMPSSTIVMPTYKNGSFGLSLNKRF